MSIVMVVLEASAPFSADELERRVRDWKDVCVGGASVGDGLSLGIALGWCGKAQAA